MRGLSLLSAANLAAAAAGFVQTMIVVRVLDVAGYGALAVMASLVAVAANVLDVRIADLASRLYYAASSAAARGPSPREVVAGALFVQALVGAVVAALASLLLIVFAHGLAPAAPGAAYLALFACAEGLLLPLANLLPLAQRLRERFAAMALAQVAGAALRAGVVLGALALRPDVTGAVLGLAGAAVGGLALQLGVAWHAWRDEGPLRTIRPAVACAAYWRERRALLSLNLVNYQNLLHRAADVLAVGFVAGEAAAGVYRFARTCTDALYVVLLEASSKVYQPLLLRLLAEGRADEFRRNAGLLVRVAAALVVLGLALESVTLDALVARVVGPSFLPAVPAIMLLTVPLFFVVGLGLWTWPLLMHVGRIDTFVACSFVAVLAGQYALPLAGIALVGGSAVTWFAAGYLLYYVLLYARVLPRVAAIHPEALPALVAPVVRGAA